MLPSDLSGLIGARDVEVGGVRCSTVLGWLSEYLDGELDRDARASVEAHVQGCDNCARFGGRFASMVAGLRRDTDAAPPSALAAARTGLGS